MDPSGPTPQASEAEFVSARVIDAPRERLFDAFSDSRALAEWWGPRGFTNEFHEFDLRPGGRWRFDMVGPDGARYAQDKTFVDVERPARIAFRHAQENHNFVMTMTFEEDARGTRVTWRMRFASREELAAVAHLLGQANEENFDRLAEHVARKLA